MSFCLSSLSVACALGRTNDEVWRNYVARSDAGMVELAGDIPGRSIYFGMVPGEVGNGEPSSAKATEGKTGNGEFDFRSCDLLTHAVANMPGLGDFIARYGADRVGIVLGASNTGIDEAQRYVDQWLDSGEKPMALDVSMIELGTPADHLKRITGVKGPAYIISTACSSATKAFAAARRLIEAGVVDACITGGVDGRCRFAMNGFHALGALSQGKCRPLADDRDGINLGEGVALFTLERTPVSRLSSVALAEEGSQFPILLAGCGESSDAYHPTAPDPEGNGAEVAMRAAIDDAGLKVSDVDYVNLHGTGTQANDSMELKACGRVFGESHDGTVLESTKNLTGHCLGAAGAVEAAICWLKLANGECRSALSNSFAFGGSNAAVLLTR